MDSHSRQHLKVRFGRGDIRPLHTLPSGRAALHGLLIRRRRRGRMLRVMGWAVSTFFVLLLLAMGAVYFAGVAGIGGDRLRDEASRAISAIVGFEVRTEIGPMWLTVDSSRFLALQIADVKAVRIDTGEPLLEAGRLRFGLRFNPLLGGEVKLGNAMIADARINLGALPESEGPGWTSGLVDDRGLIQPDLVNEKLFDALRSAFNAVAAGDTRNLSLEDVTLVLGREEPLELLVDSFEVTRPVLGTVGLEGQVVIDNRTLSIAGQARRDVETSVIEDVSLSVEISDVPADAEVEKYAFLEGLGAARLAITGREGRDGQPSRIATTIDVDDYRVELENNQRLQGSIKAQASLVSGSGKLEINSSEVQAGRSVYAFNGAIGPMPEGNAAYRYELVSDRSVSAPADSPEGSIEFAARLAGEYDPAARRLTAQEIGIRTANGLISGNAITTFRDGLSPGLFLSIVVPEMPVAEVKQIWPFFAAPGARRWVLNNLFAGKVVNSSLRIDVPPGGLSDGIPMKPEEGEGHFEVEGTRFDVAGRLPPIRDGFGKVDFRGTDVDISLSSGTVYMSSGRTVAASNGTLTLHNSHRQPLIGNLEIDVAGEAPGIVELASYEPIDVSRFIDLPPEKVSGQVTGKVVAQIPFERDVRAADLDWDVVLDFKQLGIDQEFEGQKIAEADGRLLIDPDRADFTASGKLNGVPANIALIQPFGDSGVAKKTDVELVLDDAARDAMFPGLNTVLGGSAKVKLAESSTAGKRTVTADLRQSVVRLPWVGWSKGAGVPAQATFDVTQDGGRVAITDFRLNGESFAASGSIDVVEGNLQSLRLSGARLSRDDRFAVELDRKGSAYDIRVNGSRLDARSVIKTVLGDATGGGDESDRTAVSVRAKLAEVAGFGGEVLKDVDVIYQSRGEGPGNFEMSGTTSSGRRATATDATSGGRRSLVMNSRDAGAVLRFLDIYDRMRGGSVDLALVGPSNGVLRGQLDLRDFEVVNEPRLASVVSSRPQGERSLNDALEGRLDVSRVPFELARATVEQGQNTIRVADGILRGSTIGVSFQGLVKDANGNIDMTGTFMPAYGINRMFGEIPLLGMFLGNGRDRALIGITFRLAGKLDAPDVQVNPISAIAPGIFRSIFEYR